MTTPQLRRDEAPLDTHQGRIAKAAQGIIDQIKTLDAELAAVPAGEAVAASCAEEIEISCIETLLRSAAERLGSLDPDDADAINDAIVMLGAVPAYRTEGAPPWMLGVARPAAALLEGWLASGADDKGHLALAVDCMNGIAAMLRRSLGV